MSRQPSIEVFIGAPIEHESERSFLRQLAEKLRRERRSAVVLANFEVDGRQCDFVVASENGIIVVETKSTTLPVRGEVNGIWERLLPSGALAPYGNPYTQALSVKNRVRDAIRRIDGTIAGYPEGMVVFMRALPPGSEVPAGDRKVGIGSFQDFEILLDASSPIGVTLDTARHLARSLNLAAAPIDVALGNDAAAIKREEAARAYLVNFEAEYGSGEPWLPEHESQRERLREAYRSGAGCFLEAASGCGKTLALRWLAAESSREGDLVVFLSGKDIGGTLGEALKRELALISEEFTTSTLATLARRGRPVALFLDGLNELSPDRQKTLLRGMKALARRYDARLVLSSQAAPLADLRGLTTLAFTTPSIDLKLRIASSSGRPLGASALALLGAVKTGFEAHVVGQIGDQLPLDVSRASMIDQFARSRLGDNARNGSRGLRQLAAHLQQNFSYSLSEAAFDDLMLGFGVSLDLCDALFHTRLLTRRGDRVSFGHELFQLAFAARFFASMAASTPAEVGTLLNRPGFRSFGADVLAEIELPETATRTLEAIEDADLIAKAADGELGPVAKIAGSRVLENAFAFTLAEIKAAELKIEVVEKGWPVRWSAEVERTPSERAQQCALGLRGYGDGNAAFFELCRAMDQRLLDERRRLDEQARSQNVGLRAPAFALAYLGFYGEHGFTRAARSAGGHPLSKVRAKPPMDFAALSSGELYFVLKGRYEFFDKDEHADWLAEQLAIILEKRWRAEPYHVRLELLTMACYVRWATDAIRLRLIAAIDALSIAEDDWALGSSRIDALKCLGALEDAGEEQRPGIREDVAFVTGDDESEDIRDRALSLYVSIFDHPFDQVFAEEINGLPDDKRRTLYRRALGAERSSESMSLRWLSLEIANFEDPADVTLFERFAGLPTRDSVMPQDGMSAFATAVRVLARFGVTLPAVVPSNEIEVCMDAARTLLYLAERDVAFDGLEAEDAWERLRRADPALAFGCLAELIEPLEERFPHDRPGAYPPLDLPSRYAGGFLALVRRMLSANAMPTSYSGGGYMRPRDLGVAFRIIEQFGGEDDIPLLRELAKSKDFAFHAVTALRHLEGASVA